MLLGFTVQLTQSVNLLEILEYYVCVMHVFDKR